MTFRIFFFAFLLCLTNRLNAQDNQTGTTKHEGHKSHNHDHHKNEIGIANAPVYFVKEKVFSYGLHLHYIRNIRESKFGLGAGFERIFDEHGHNTFGLVASYRPIDKLSLSLSPGITLEDVHPDELNFALHVETAYEFEINNIHIGPVFEFAYDPEDFHISFGLHIGYGF